MCAPSWSRCNPRYLTVGCIGIRTLFIVTGGQSVRLVVNVTWTDFALLIFIFHVSTLTCWIFAKRREDQHEQQVVRCHPQRWRKWCDLLWVSREWRLSRGRFLGHFPVGHQTTPHDRWSSSCCTWLENSGYEDMSSREGNTDWAVWSWFCVTSQYATLYQMPGRRQGRLPYTVSVPLGL